MHNLEKVKNPNMHLFAGPITNDDTYRWNCDVILRTNRVRCALNMENLDLLNEESVSGACSGKASL